MFFPFLLPFDLPNGKPQVQPNEEACEGKNIAKNHALICDDSRETRGEENAEEKKNELMGKSSTNNFNLQYDISLFDSFILLFDINGEMRILKKRRCVL